MKISTNWLRDFIDTDKTTEDIGNLLTDCGLEVEGITPYHSIPGALKGIVVGLVLSTQKHPNADKLNICQVDLGNNTIKQIVCGAPNVAAGQKVLVATVGSTVHPIKGEPFTINKAKIRGEVSEGMICAEDELSLGISHDGILILPDHYEVGKAAAGYFDMYSDEVFEIGLTANRGDAASHLGVARDLRAMGVKVKPYAQNISGSIGQAAVATPVQVSILDHEGCKRYSGLSISGITVKPSPAWLQNRLKAIGLSPINNIVDATNYVLHGLGQPLHAFDADKIAGNKIIVKKAEAGSVFVTLDKTERKLTGVECMIWDDEKPLAIAGIFGGLHSGINELTTNIFLESAYFDSGSIRKSAKAHGLNTDASFRFERGTDPDITLNALEFAASIIIEIAGGSRTSEVVDVYPEPILPRQISFNPYRSNELIGKEISDSVMLQILSDLEIKTIQTGAHHWDLSVPPYRVDITRPIDITEEILRIYGLNNIEIGTHINSAVNFSDDEAGLKLKNRLGNYLSANGFNEIITNTLTTPQYYNEQQLQSAVKLLNPLSNDLAVMRMDMINSMLESVQYNNNRKNSDLRFYEFGKTYQRFGDENDLKNYHEKKHLSLGFFGKKMPEGWNNYKDEYGYFGVKNILEQVLKQGGLNQIQYSFEPDERLEHATQIKVKRTAIGVFGMVNKKRAAAFDIDKPLWYADIDMDLVTGLTKDLRFSLKPVSVFPPVRRDLALVITNETSYDQLEKIALKTEPNLIKRINAFDVYKDEKIGEGKKSYALSFILQDENKTLTEEEIDGVMKKLIVNFEKDAGALLRS